MHFWSNLRAIYNLLLIQRAISEHMYSTIAKDCVNTPLRLRAMASCAIIWVVNWGEASLPELSAEVEEHVFFISVSAAGCNTGKFVNPGPLTLEETTWESTRCGA